MTKTCEIAARAGGAGFLRSFRPLQNSGFLVLGLVLAAASASVRAEPASGPAPPVPLPAERADPAAVCPVTGLLRLTDQAMLDRFQALSRCRAQAIPAATPGVSQRPSSVALEGQGEGKPSAPEDEQGGAVEVRGDPAADRDAALLTPSVLPATQVELAAAVLPDMIVRLRPSIAEMDLVAPRSEAAALQDTSILAFAPRSYTTRHDQLIAVTARRHRIDPLLLHAMVRQESNYGAGARSRAGAIGLMQIMPATGARFGRQAAVLADPASNLDTGARLLRALHARYGNDFDLILAAYNAGEGAVARHGNRVPPFRETRDYVRLVKGHYAALAAQNGQSLATRF